MKYYPETRRGRVRKPAPEERKPDRSEPVAPRDQEPVSASGEPPGREGDIAVSGSSPVDRPPSVVRSAGIVSAAVGLSRITGLVREMVMARLFGAGQAYDAFLVGFRIPNLTRDLFAEGALSSAFVPTFTEYLKNRSKEEAARLSNLVATALLIIVGLLCLLGIVFSPQLVGLLAAGWKSDPAKFALAVNLTRTMFPFLLLVALAAQVMGILNACNKFGVPALASTFFNLGSVGAGILIGVLISRRFSQPAIEGMAYGVVIGGALQLLVQIPSLFRAGFTFRPLVDFSHPGLRHIFHLMGPAILGNAAVQINVMVNTNFASTVVDPVRGLDGPVGWLGYAFRFMQLPLGLFGVAIASATLPAISRSAASGNIGEFRRTLSRSLGLVFLLTIPSSVGLAILGDTMIGLIYQQGKFNAYDTRQTAVALSCYAIGLAAYAGIKVIAPAFYALGSARVPMMVSLFSIAINFVVAWALTQRTGLGHAGLALATSGVALFNFFALFWLIRLKTRGIHGRALGASVGKIAAAALAMGAVVTLSSHTIHAEMGVARISRLVDLAVSIPLGALVFYIVCRLLRVSELDAAIKALPLSRVPFIRRVKIQR